MFPTGIFHSSVDRDNTQSRKGGQNIEGTMGILGNIPHHTCYLKIVGIVQTENLAHWIFISKIFFAADSVRTMDLGSMRAVCGFPPCQEPETGE